MPRRVQIPTIELGSFDLFLIYQYGDTWEKNWAPAQHLPWAQLLTVVSEETMVHAFNRWTNPLVKALGIAPVGAIKKLPILNQKCYRRVICPLCRPKDCLPHVPQMPWCYEPDGVDDPEARRLITEAIQLWRQGVYIVVVVHAEEC